jgi:phosphinothricin acetyltransferase
MRPEDWEEVRRIFLEGIATGQATFETEASGYSAWDDAHRPGTRLVAYDSEEILGWAALSPVSGRAAYAGVVEVSVYVSERHRGKGVGAALLSALIRESEEIGIWTLQASIFPENGASLRLHERRGFRVVGRRERIGQLAGEWRDVLLLERRSRLVGIE